jgi:hypothetical protein
MARKFSTQAFVASVGIASVLAVSVAAIPKVKADSADCTREGSCVQVKGRRLYVNDAIGGVTLSPRGEIYGHTEVWGSYLGRNRFHKNTADKTLSNSAVVRARVWDTQFVDFNGELPDGSKVCARFWQKVGGNYQSLGIACLTIERI